jgi:hypothetical protein
LDVPGTYGIVDSRHDDGDRRVGPLERGQRGPCGDDHIHLKADQFVGQSGKALRLAVGPPRFGHEVLAVHVAELTHPAQESLDGRRPWLRPDQIRGRPETEDPDPVDPARWLCTADTRHGEHAAGRAHDQGTSIDHSIT